MSDFLYCDQGTKNLKVVVDEEPSPDAEADLLITSHEKAKTKKHVLNSSSYRVVWGCHVLLILLCIAILSHAIFLHQKLPKNCLEKFNSYSPILEAIDEDRLENIRFKYSLWYQSPFKGPPTPEVEEAWHSIMNYGEISVSASDIIKIGHNLSAVQFPPEVGGGYAAIASGTHALHCLHYIWQDHYSEIIPEVQKNQLEVPEMYERHYEHCVDYMRQYVMCKFDTTLIPLNWVRDHQNPTPNGNTMHKCVNWNSLQEWLENRAVKMPDGFKWSQPADAEVLPDNP